MVTGFWPTHSRQHTGASRRHREERGHAEQQTREVLAEISAIKAGGTATAHVLRCRGPRAAFLHAFYCASLAVGGRVDLDDLVPLAAQLLHRNPAVKAAMSECAPTCAPTNWPPITWQTPCAWSSLPAAANRPWSLAAGPWPARRDG